MDYLENISNDINSDNSHPAVDGSDSLIIFIRNGVSINYPDMHGMTHLHYACLKKQETTVKVLLQNGADLARANKYGHTPLHLATYVRSDIIVDIILQFICGDVIDAKDALNGDTPLHIAAKSGSIKIVTSLLINQANVKIENLQGFTPKETTNHKKVVDLISLHEKFIKELENYEFESTKLFSLDEDERSFFVNALIYKKKLLYTPKKSFLTENQLEHLIYLSDFTLGFNFYLEIIQGYSDRNELDGWSRWKTLKEGSYYLGNNYDLIKKYRNCVPGPIQNADIELIDDILKYFEFDRKHICIGGQYFASRGQGTRYYELLHSKCSSGIRKFLELVYTNIETPLKRFRISMKEKLWEIYFDTLLIICEGGDTYEFDNLMKRVSDNYKTKKKIYIDFFTTVDVCPEYGSSRSKFDNNITYPLLVTKKTTNGKTAVHVAAEHGNLEIVKSLLQHGASYNVKNDEGKTPMEVTKHLKIINFLKMVHEMFEDVKKNDLNVIVKLKTLNTNDLLAVLSARNNQDETLFNPVYKNNVNEEFSTKCFEVLFR